VAGDSTTGIWNTDDFIPRLIKGCIQLGRVPDSRAMIEMAPVNYVSRIIIHLSLQRELQSSVFHVVSPHLITARELGSIVGSLGYNLTLVSFADWRNALLDDAKTSSKNALYPLLGMFADPNPSEVVPTFDCRNTLEGLRGTQLLFPEVGTDLMATYLTYFRSSGFLDT
jgi:thioester reductase-like protein